MLVDNLDDPGSAMSFSGKLLQPAAVRECAADSKSEVRD